MSDQVIINKILDSFQPSKILPSWPIFLYHSSDLEYTLFHTGKFLFCMRMRWDNMTAMLAQKHSRKYIIVLLLFYDHSFFFLFSFLILLPSFIHQFTHLVEPLIFFYYFQKSDPYKRWDFCLKVQEQRFTIPETILSNLNPKRIDSIFTINV